MPLGSKSMDQDPNTPPWGSARLTYSRCLTKLWHDLMPLWSWHLWSPGSWFTFKKHHTHGKDISDIATNIAYSAFAPPWTCLLWWKNDSFFYVFVHKFVYVYWYPCAPPPHEHKSTLISHVHIHESTYEWHPKSHGSVTCALFTHNWRRNSQWVGTVIMTIVKL